MKKKKTNNVYTRIVTIFLMLTIIAIFVVLHFALAKVTIKIYSHLENKQLSGIIEVQSESTDNISPDNILGKIITVENELTVTIASSQNSIESDKAGGYVTIYNNHSVKQALVATTRLLTPDNKLFRIKEGITIPPNSNLKVWAEADQSGEGYITEATTFIIPGLWEGLQDKIYAETTEGMKLTSIPTYLTTQENLDKANEEIYQKAIVQALGSINDQLNKNLWVDEKRLNLTFETIEMTPLNTEASELILTQKIIANGLIISEDDLLNTAKAKFTKELNEDQSLKEFDDNTFTFNILEIYPEKNEAILEISIDAIINSNEHLWDINKDELIGLTEFDIQEYLKQYNIDNAEIKFFPFWVDKVPRLKDHIIIE